LATSRSRLLPIFGEGITQCFSHEPALCGGQVPRQLVKATLKAP